MLRASSEIAVATSVASAGEKPRAVATVLPSARARTMSESVSTATCFSQATQVSSGVGAKLGTVREIAQSLLQVQLRRHIVQAEPQLRHRERHLGLNPHDHGLRTTQPDHLRDL